MHFDPATSLEEQSIARTLDPRWPYAVTSGILGWVLDAFDFFIVVFLVDILAANFHVEKKAIVWTISVTLAMRPVGALLFGSLADRFGRKRPLMAVVVYFSTISVLSAFAPNYTVFLILRGLYGIGMGGYWGIGASFAMESAPISKRGFLSGLMQGGYPFGYLLAAVAVIFIQPAFGWRAMFYVGMGLAAITVLITLRAPESEAWQEHRLPSIAGLFRVALQHGKSFLYLLLLMTVMTNLSHGSQDLYPDFLKTAYHASRNTTSYIAICYNIGAILGALFFGQISERIGRRRSILCGLALSLASIPAWAFGHTLAWLVAGSFVMQAGVQGAFGVLPAHLNELSPDAVRGLFPGFVYQLGVLLGSPGVSVEYWLRDSLGYRWALTAFELVVICLLIVIYILGPEKKGKDFRRASTAIQATI